MNGILEDILEVCLGTFSGYFEGALRVSYNRLDGLLRLSGGYFVGDWRVSFRCRKGILWVSGGHLRGVKNESCGCRNKPPLLLLPLLLSGIVTI